MAHKVFKVLILTTVCLCYEPRAWQDTCNLRTIYLFEMSGEAIVQNMIGNFKLSRFIRRVGLRVKWELLKFIEISLDCRYNINARSNDRDPAFPDDTGYSPVDYSGLKCIREKIGLGAKEVLVDIGCGRGRALCVFSRQPAIVRCVGIEYLATHVRIAQQNAQRMRGRIAPITIIQGDAGEQSYNDVTLIFLFNPFGEATMRRTIHRIGLSFQRSPRPMKLVYVNPRHENVFAEQPWLTKIDSFCIPNGMDPPLATSVWSSAECEGI